VITQFCHQHRIRKLSFFGSSAPDEFVQVKSESCFLSVVPNYFCGSIQPMPMLGAQKKTEADYLDQPL